MGKLSLSLEVPRCDAPDVICDTFSKEPVFPGLVSQSGMNLQLDCGADLRKGTTSCPASRKATFKISKEGDAIYALPANQNVIYEPGIPFDGCRSTTRSDERIRLDSFRPDMDFCVRHRDGLISHVYYQGEELSGSAFRFWQTTTRPVKK